MDWGVRRFFSEFDGFMNELLGKVVGKQVLGSLCTLLGRILRVRENLVCALSEGGSIVGTFLIFRSLDGRMDIRAVGEHELWVVEKSTEGLNVPVEKALGGLLNYDAKDWK